MRKTLLLMGLLLMPTLTMAAEAEQAIRDGVAQVADGINGGDAAKAAAVFAENAVMLAPDGSRIDGRAGVQEVLQSIIDANITYRRIDVTDIGIDGALAWNAGTFEAAIPLADGSSIAETGTYAIVWGLESDGAWRIRLDTWNEATHPE